MHPLLPKTIKQLLPNEDNNSSKALFITVGPTLIDALSNGEDFIETCNKLHLDPYDAALLLGSDEFIKYIEAYISLGDLTDKTQRIRLTKAILASQIANGMTFRRKEPMDLIEHIRKELQISDHSSQINVQIVNTSVPRPYSKLKETKILPPQE